MGSNWDIEASLMAVITLLTDFGLQDEYVGVLKGVIYSINPKAVIVDLNHNIEARNITQASHLLKAAMPFFPENSIHLAIVDPGVGSDRAILVSRQDGKYTIAPDNGLLGPLWEKYIPEKVVKLNNQRYFRHPVSRTFHGRDIFAPAAAHLSLGVKMDEFGPVVKPDQAVDLRHAKPTWHSAHSISGEVVWIDHFGNLITNIELEDLVRLGADRAPEGIQVVSGSVCISGISESYSQASSGQVLAIIGSRNCLEIAVNQASAASILGLVSGSVVSVRKLTL